MRRRTACRAGAVLLATALGSTGCGQKGAQADRPLPSPELLAAHCRDVVGEPRVLEPSPGVFVAVGYDLANTTLIATPEGNVVVDPGMSPARAAPVREALLAKSPGPVAAVVFTHSHIDHVGGAQVWVEPGTQIWATARFEGHFYKQYDRFLRAETARGARQFGRDVPREQVPCSGLGRAVDIDAATAVGVRMPTQTFSGRISLDFGGVPVELVEAHGETDDQLYVWLPESRTLLPGDNYYRAFPNLYTIRGSRPRPVDAWIASLDAMRREQPAVLIPSHTVPVQGEAEVQHQLRVYRDGIQWVRDHAVRGANAGLPLERIVETAGLPRHLADEPALQELYGQIDWSVRALYANELGWFDGQAGELYPLPASDRARRTVQAMGGIEAVRAAASGSDDPRWSIELLRHLEFAGEPVDAELAAAYEQLAAGVANTNGRAYLLQAARERRGEARPLPSAKPSDAFVAAMPLEQLFGNLETRLLPERALDVHEAARFEVDDRVYTVTVRYGVAEVAAGEPLPGTPAPTFTVRTTADVWRRLATRKLGPAAAIASGALQIDGGALAFKGFMDRFDRRLVVQPEVLP